MKDVAERAEVSIKTVSRVVNGDREISIATRGRVQAAIDALGFRPNLTARGLVTQRSSILGLVIGDICNPFSAQLARGAQEVAEADGKSLIIASCEGSLEKELHILSTFVAQTVDAVILATAMVPQVLKAFGGGRRPIILINNSSDQPSVGSVIVDNYAGALAAMRHLISRGHRKIGMLAGIGANPSGTRRVRAFRDALLESGLEYDDSLIGRTLHRMHEGNQAAKDLLGRRPDLTALFCYNDLLALGALRAAAELGRRVPHDLAVIGFDDIDFASIVTPSLTTVHVDIREVGRRAASLALRMARDMDSTPKTIQMSAELVIRESA